MPRSLHGWDLRYCALHDADRRQMDMQRLSANIGKHGFEVSRLRKELEQCDMQAFLSAQQRLTELRDEAIKLVLPVLKRLTAEFDKELSSVAICREEELAKMGVALFSDRWTDRGETRDYALYADPVVTG